MAKRYFVIADVHGFYDLMVKALNEAGFDYENPNHILISLGDLTDRGPQPVECIEYVMGLPEKRRHLIRGNHDELVDNLFSTSTYGGHDITNGTWDTVRRFAEHERHFVISKQLAEMNWMDVIMDARKYRKWVEYYDSLVNYWEMDHFVFVHGWIPLVRNWRKNAKEDDWNRAIWAKTPQLTAAEHWDDKGKVVVCGHWHSEAWWSKDGYPYIFKTYTNPHFIALDAATAFSRQMNVLVIENDGIVGNYNVDEKEVAQCNYKQQYQMKE